MMTARTTTLMVLFLLLVGVGPYRSEPVSPRADNQLVTLWANDETLATFDFTTGTHGSVVKDGELILDGTQIAFNVFEKNQLSYGYVRGIVSEIIDLGDVVIDPVDRPDDRSPKPVLNLFHSLDLRDGHFIYRAPIDREIRHTEAQKIFKPLPRDFLVSFEPEVGHTYVMRFKPRGEKEEQSTVLKLLIIDFQPGHLLTFRWQKL